MRLKTLITLVTLKKLKSDSALAKLPKLPADVKLKQAAMLKNESTEYKL